MKCVPMCVCVRVLVSAWMVNQVAEERNCITKVILLISQRQMELPGRARDTVNTSATAAVPAIIAEASFD